MGNASDIVKRIKVLAYLPRLRHTGTGLLEVRANVETNHDSGCTTV